MSGTSHPPSTPILTLIPFFARRGLPFQNGPPPLSLRITQFYSPPPDIKRPGDQSLIWYESPPDFLRSSFSHFSFVVCLSTFASLPLVKRPRLLTLCLPLPRPIFPRCAVLLPPPSYRSCSPSKRSAFSPSDTCPRLPRHSLL